MSDGGIAERVTPILTRDVWVLAFKGLIPKSIQTNIGTLTTTQIAQYSGGQMIGIISTGSTTITSITI